MINLKRLCLILASGFVLAGCSLPTIGGKNQGALQVTTNTASEVYLDDVHVGQSPYYDENLKVGEYTLKIVPAGEEDKSWQSKIKINKRVLSVVTYEFGENKESGGYEIMELTPLTNKSATEIAITSVPDNVVIKLDGEIKGFTPISFENLTPGDHTIALEAAGYKPKTINAKTNEGHRLNIIVRLTRTNLIPEDNTASPSATTQVITDDAEPKASPSPSPKTKTSPSPSPKPSASPTTKTDGVISGESSSANMTAPYAQVLDTGLGWLRVRSEPTGVGDNEVAKVAVGGYFPFVEKDETGWAKIEYETGLEGWVASKYLNITE